MFGNVSIEIIIVIGIYFVLRDVSSRCTDQQIVRAYITLLVLAKLTLTLFPRWLRITLMLALLTVFTG
jgi:hypothetical protein